MDYEFNKTLIGLDNKVSHIFQDFTARFAKIEELTNLGNQLLMKFHQEIEFFRRPPLQKISKVVQDVIEANQTSRLKSYIESGCRHAYLDVQNICNLNLCQQGLQDHLIKVKPLLAELECLCEDGITVMQTANESISHLCDKCFSYCSANQLSSSEEVELELAIYQNKPLGEEQPPFESILLRAMLMRIVYNMLKLDYEMQRKVVLSLNLNSSSEELGSYCLMWDLRPFINDDIMKQCWRFVHKSSILK